MRKSYPFNVGDRVMTIHGRGTVVKHDTCLTRPAVLHDVFPINTPKIYKDNLLYYFKSDFKETHNR